MFAVLLILHSYIRYLAVALLLYSIANAYLKGKSNKPFTKNDNSLRHWTATIAHIQLTIGIWIFTQSPLVQLFWKQYKNSSALTDFSFFGFIHPFLMLIAVVILTIGSAKSKRKQLDHDKYKTILWWFSIALILIFVAIPWPFSPLSNRPYFK